jgi:hypothetical protein
MIWRAWSGKEEGDYRLVIFHSWGAGAATHLRVTCKESIRDCAEKTTKVYSICCEQCKCNAKVHSMPVCMQVLGFL